MRSFVENQVPWRAHNLNMETIRKLAVKSKPVIGIRSSSGLRLLDEDPFEMGGQVPLRTDEEMFCYLSREDLARATRRRDDFYANDKRLLKLLMAGYVLSSIFFVLILFVK